MAKPIRATLTTWIEVVAVTDDATGITTLRRSGRQEAECAHLAARAVQRRRPQATYELGLDGSPLLCLAAIPLDPSVPADAVLDEIAAGSTFADAAGTYSIDALARQTPAASSRRRMAPSASRPAQFNPDLIAAMNAAGPAVGEPAVITLQNQEVVILLRPFDDLTLSEAEKLQLSANELGTALRTSYDTAEITVDARVGKWDPTDARVVPVGEG